MKNYLVFAGKQYYASGGFEDFHSDYATLDEAIQVADGLHEDTPGDRKWSHVVSLSEKQIVHENGEAYT